MQLEREEKQDAQSVEVLYNRANDPDFAESDYREALKRFLQNLATATTAKRKALLRGAGIQCE